MDGLATIYLHYIVKRLSMMLCAELDWNFLSTFKVTVKNVFFGFRAVRKGMHGVFGPNGCMIVYY